MSKHPYKIIVLMLVNIFFILISASSVEAAVGPYLGGAPLSGGRCIINGPSCGAALTDLQCCEAYYGVGNVGSTASVPIGFSTFGSCGPSPSFSGWRTVNNDCYGIAPTPTPPPPPPPPPPTPPPAPPTGGLVPCGRLGNDPATAWDDTAPCNLCFAFQMVKNILDYIFLLAVGIAIFIFVIAGLLYAFSAGNPGSVEKAKSAIKYAAIGLAIVFVAWLMVYVVLSTLGYSHPFSGDWSMINCSLP